MKRLRFLCALAGAGLALAVPACSKDTGPRTDAPIQVGFVSNNAKQFWTIAEAGTSEGARKYGVEVLFRRPQSGTASEQKKIIEDLLAQGVKAIAISVTDPKNQTDFLNEVAARVPLLTQDNDAPESKRLCYVGTDNYTAGQAAGKLVKEALPQGGTIAIFVGQAEAINGQERRQGVLDVLAGQKNAPGPEKFGNYTLYSPPALYDYVSDRKCKEKAAETLTALQGSDRICLVGLWEYNPPALLGAVEDASKLGKVAIVGFDENDVTLQGVKDGNIVGTVVQQPYLFGMESVRVMAALARGDRKVLPADGKLYIPHKVIRKDIVDEFRKDLHAKLGK
jgi:ribose transport system substrate-binding protein